jgi:O-antigen/teichoic acid export membrane protein
MQNKMFQNAKLNALTGYLNFVISSVLVFFLSPFLVKFLGTSTFGIWKSIQKILSFATIADGRATQALKWIIANDEVNENVKVKQQAVGSALKVWVYFLPFVLLIVFLLVWNLPSLINGLNKEMIPVLYQVGVILGVNLVLNPLMGIPDAILVGTNNGYRSTFIQTIGIIISNLLMLLVSYLGFGLVGLGYVVIFVTLLNGGLIFYVCKKNISWFGIQKPNKEQVQEFFKFSFWVFIWSFVQKLILSTEIILIGYLLNPETVTGYVFTTYIIQLAVSVALLTGSAITPTLGKLIGANEMPNARGVVKNIREIILCISLFFGSLVLFINESFVDLWMGSTFYLGSYTNVLIVLIMVNMVQARIEGQIQDLSLNIRKKVLIGALFSFLSVILGVLGFFFFEKRIEGMFFGVLIGRIFLNLSFTHMVNKMMKLPSYFIKYVYIALFLSGTFTLQKVMPKAESWFSLVMLSIPVSLVLGILTFQIILSKTSKKKIIQLVFRK